MARGLPTSCEFVDVHAELPLEATQARGAMAGSPWCNGIPTAA
jgi:hypothetical protein